MTHTTLTDHLRDHAALYALDALPPAERRAFEAHLADGCTICRDEVAALEQVTGALALAPDAASPSAAVKARLLADASTPPPFTFVGEDEGEWREVEPRVFRKRLYGRPGGASRSYLIRMEPGSRIPAHRHHAPEHCYVIQGDVRLGGRRIQAGDFHLAEAGTLHEETTTERGCLFLVVESAGAAA